MQNHRLLAESEDYWVSDVGAWLGNRVMYRDKDLFRDFTQLNWIALLLYGITGKILSREQARLFEGMWMITTSYPDPRIWNNRIAALAGTVRSTAALGLSAATAVADAVIYGHRPTTVIMDFLLKTQRRLDSGEDLEQILEGILKPSAREKSRSGSGTNRKVAMVPGYGRPVTSADERIEPLMNLAKELGFNKGPAISLVFQIEKKLLTKNKNLRVTAAAVVAGLAADQQLTPHQFYYFMLTCCNAGIIPCLIDAAEKNQGTFFPLSCSRIQYEGFPRRIWKIEKTGNN